MLSSPRPSPTHTHGTQQHPGREQVLAQMDGCALHAVAVWTRGGANTLCYANEAVLYNTGVRETR